MTEPDPVVATPPHGSAPPSRGGEYPNLRQIALALALLPVSFLVQAGLYPALPRFSVVASGATMIVISWALMRRWGLDPRQVLLLRGVRKGVLILTAALTGVLALVLAEVQALTSPFLPMPARFAEFLEKMTDLLSADHPADFLVAAIAISLFPALSEEMLFRGIVFTGLRRRFGAVAGVLGAGGLFAVVHLNPWQFLPLFLIGTFLSFVVHRTNSLYPGIVAHAANNLLSLTALNLGRRFAPETLDPQAHLPPAIVGGALGAFAAGIILLVRITPTTGEDAVSHGAGGESWAIGATERDP